MFSYGWLWIRPPERSGTTESAWHYNRPTTNSRRYCQNQKTPRPVRRGVFSSFVLIHPGPPSASRLHHLPLLCRNKPQTVTGHMPRPSSGPRCQQPGGDVPVSPYPFPGLDHAPPFVERICIASDKDFSACASLIADSIG